MRHILKDKDGRVAFVENLNPSLGGSELIGYSKTAIKVEDKQWRKMRKDMVTHDISIDPQHNTLKSIKRRGTK